MKKQAKTVTHIKGTNIPHTEAEIQTINHRKRLRQADSLLAYQRLLQAASHFDDTSDLDKRAYFITVNLRYNCLDQIRKPIYFKLKQVTQNHAFGGGPGRPGLVLYDDVSGSKYNKAFDNNHHFHGILLMPKSQKSLNTHTGFIAETVKQRVGEISEVSSVDCQPYRYDEPLDYVIGYADKFVRKSGHEAFGAQQFQSVAYPYDFDVQARGRTDSDRQQPQSSYGRLLNLFRTNPAALFSEEYMHHFGENITRLCKDVRTDSTTPRLIKPVPLKIAA